MLGYSIASFCYSKFLAPIIAVITTILHVFYISLPYFAINKVARPLVINPISYVFQYLLRFYYVRLPFSILREVVVPSLRVGGRVLKFFVALTVLTAVKSYPLSRVLSLFYFVRIPLGIKDSVVPATKIFLGAVAFLVFVAPLRAYQHILLPLWGVSISYPLILCFLEIARWI